MSQNTYENPIIWHLPKDQGANYFGFSIFRNPQEVNEADENVEGS